jgi:cytochrome c-type biogenesis protein CcmH/NrfG
MPFRLVSIVVTISFCALEGLSQSSAPPASKLDQHLGLAKQYLQQKRPDLAIPELEAAAAIDPANTDTQANLGVLYYFGHNYAKALPRLRSAVKAKPELWNIQALLGLAEARSGDKDASRQDLEAAFPHLKEEKIKTEVGQALVDSYTGSDDLEKAAATVSTMLASRPTDPSLLFMASRLYSDLADRSTLTLALTAPDGVQLHEIMARELARQGDDTGAIANYREALRIDPKLPELHSNLGQLLYNSQDAKLQAEAEGELNTALRANPRDTRSEMTLGMIAEKRGDSNGAYAHYSHVLEIDPNSSDACTEVAKLLVSMSQREKAQQLFERAIQLDPTNYIAHYRLSTLYRQAGKTDEAKQQASEYLKYKQMKSKLEKIFHDMRIPGGDMGTDEPDAK